MLINLKNRALLKLTGSENEAFLQAQLSNDITKLDNSSVQLNAYCQHQGKILALFWVMRSGDDFLLSFPLDLIDSIKDRLQMFVLIADVKITDVTEQYLQIGVIGKSQKDSLTINEQLSLILAEPKNLSKFDLTSQEYWDKACIDSFLPEVNITSTETYIPQMLNLDINEFGVNFSKGCFPGQEVVARLHYLGKAKRRLFAFKSDSPLSLGDTLHCAESKSVKASGNVVSQVKFGSDFYCLATLEVENKDNRITINNDQGPTLIRINNE
ncbi:folate-binding protein YgfZ [Candidatus Thioglobus sp.]|nr:folate-binding protein YgfZ [Candidatus Thioglobus sp.]